MVCTELGTMMVGANESTELLRNLWLYYNLLSHGDLL